MMKRRFLKGNGKRFSMRLLLRMTAATGQNVRILKAFLMIAGVAYSVQPIAQHLHLNSGKRSI